MAISTKTLCIAVIATAIAIAVLTDVYFLSRDLQTRIQTLRFNLYLIADSILACAVCMLWKYTFHGKERGILNNGTTCQNIYAVPKIIVAIHFTLVILCLPLSHFIVDTEPSTLAYALFLSLGFFFQQIVMYIFIKFVDISSRVLLKSKKDVISKLTGNVLIYVYATIAVLYGLYNVSQPPNIVQINLAIENWPKSLPGFKIVQITDIHMGQLGGKSKLVHLIDQVSTLKPDSVVITGDLVDSQVNKLWKAVEPMKNLKAPYGVYFVTGNHDYYTGDVDNWFSYLKSLGIQILHNSNVKIGRDGDSVCLAGVDDITPNKIPYEGHGMDLDKALSSCNHHKATILLAHQPISAKAAVKSNYHVDLILSGHTHGGQMFPLTLALYLVSPYVAGLYQDGATYIYVSQGTFYWGIPMRIGTRMEITQFTLNGKQH